MPIIRTVWQKVYTAIATLSWSVLTLGLLGHALVSWALLDWAGERDLTGDAITFLYYYMTTATTVGYGDLSPGDRMGRLVDIVWVLPGSIALFTSVLGKAIADIGGFWRRRLQGMGDFSERHGHIVVVGWQGARTRHLIEDLAHEQGTAKGDRIVLLACGLTENPLPDTVDFVATDELSQLDNYERAGAGTAATVVVRGKLDDETLAATLAARAAAPEAHIVAYFQDAGAADLVHRQFPEIEVITSIASEMLVRAARDPGSSRLAGLMFSNRNPDTAYSFKVPEGAATMRYLPLFCALKEHHDLTVVGIVRDGTVDLNCAPDCEVSGGDTIFYIADARCPPERIDWAALAGVPA
ncbi:potassium channel family protein [Novosphingobium aquimarinum]|uniref:potassium channel family protein n=1 Tax=Novosphingobium aquimarinum TaxID=2682494 RepID=UPI001E52B765|nr:potassium channel family protein [Novosphingobium aquimarinum]